MDTIARGALDRVVLVSPGVDDLSRGDLARVVRQIGSTLRAAGVGRRDVVASLLPAGPSCASVFLGVAGAAVAAPLSPDLAPPELIRWLRDAQPTALLVAGDAQVPEDVLSGADTILGRVIPTGSKAGEVGIEFQRRTPSTDDLRPDPDDVALVLHTSGTTSRPKRVALRHRNLAASAENVATTLGLGIEDRCLDVMPLFHIHGLVAGLLASLWAGGSAVCPPQFNSIDVYDWIRSTDPTWITAVPTMYQSMLDRVAEHSELIHRSRLRLLRSSSSALAASVHVALESAFGVPVVEAYGMTEAAHQICSNTPEERIPGSVGRAAGPEVAALDAEGRRVPAGLEGEVAIRGDNVVDGYSDSDATAAAWVDGWFLTGDRGVLDDHGSLRLTGRSKEMINRGGETIAPGEVDDVLLAHPDIVRAMTFAVPDHRLGEQVAALVVPAPDVVIDERAVRGHVAARLTSSKVPRRVYAVEELPVGPTGKPRRIGIAAELGLADLDGPPTRSSAPIAPTTAVESLLHGLWTDVLARCDFGVADRFLDVGGDSMLAGRLVARVIDTLDVDISIIDFFDRPTIGEQAELVEELLLA